VRIINNKITDRKKKCHVFRQNNKFVAFHGSDMFITMYTTAQH